MNFKLFHTLTGFIKGKPKQKEVSGIFESKSEQEYEENKKTEAGQYDLIGCFILGFKKVVEFPLLTLFVFVFYAIITYHDYMLFLTFNPITTSTQIISPWGLPEIGIYFLAMLLAPYIYIFANPSVSVSNALITILWTGYIVTLIRSFFEAGYLGNMHSKLFKAEEQNFIASLTKYILRILAFALVYFTIIYVSLCAVVMAQSSIGFQIPNYMMMVFSTLYAVVTYLLMLTPYVIVAEDKGLLLAIKKSIRYMLSVEGFVYFLVLGVLTSIASSIVTYLLYIPWIGYIISLAILAFFTIALTISTFCYYKYIRLPKFKERL